MSTNDKKQANSAKSSKVLLNYEMNLNVKHNKCSLYSAFWFLCLGSVLFCFPSFVFFCWD